MPAPSGLLIGVEKFGRTIDEALAGLTDWHRQALWAEFQGLMHGRDLRRIVRESGYGADTQVARANR